MSSAGYGSSPMAASPGGGGGGGGGVGGGGGGGGGRTDTHPRALPQVGGEGRRYRGGDIGERIGEGI